MAYLGTPYRVVYEAKNRATGLSGIVATLLKPNGSSIGTFPMLELPGVFAGIYAFDLITTEADPEGEWIGTISSPSEVHKAAFRVSYELRSDVSEILSIAFGSTNVIAVVDNETEASALTSLDELQAVAEVDLETYPVVLAEQLAEAGISVENGTEIIAEIEDC